jgi:pyruvate kinase
MIRTKIICTIGPSVRSYEKIVELIRAGMNVARINFSHGTQDDHRQVIDLLKKVRADLLVPLAIMLDTKGPEVRLRKIRDGEVFLPSGHRWKLFKDKEEGDEEGCSISPSKILDAIEPGQEVLFDDGYVSSVVLEKDASGVLIEIKNGGLIRSGKGVNIPGLSFFQSAVTEQDEIDIRFGCQQDVDLIAASFVRNAEDILHIKKLLDEEKKSDILVIAKIESKEGVDNFDSIVQIADGIMIARGDLGVQVPLAQVPKFQKTMIRKSYLAGKPSVTATQMLESMINNPRPTRAEASDVANAIYDSTSSVMLSGETAVGKYPVEVVKVMRNIIEEAESDFDYREFFAQHGTLIYHDVPSAVTLATVKTAYSSNAKAIFAFTSSGTTARLISRLRPEMPIIAMTYLEKTFHQLASFWGVTPVLGPYSKNINEAFQFLSSYAAEKHLVGFGDLVVVTAGSPFGISGTTNMMMVENIGDVLVRGQLGEGSKIHARISLVISAESTPAYSVRNQLLVLTRCDESYRPLILESAGVILQNHISDTESEKWALNICREFHKPVVLRADAASEVLKEGLLVTLDPDKALVYKGVQV